MGPELGAGAEVAGFRIERLVGAGGMGAVYLATDPTLKRDVALKVIVPELADDPRFGERFLIEADLAARLEHPAIVPVYHAGESEGRLFLVMRYVTGGSLAHRLATREALSPADVVTLLQPIAAALDAAHEAGLIHRDVKPAKHRSDAVRAAGGAGHGRAPRCDRRLGRDTGLGQPRGAADAHARRHPRQLRVRSGWQPRRAPDHGPPDR